MSSALCPASSGVVQAIRMGGLGGVAGLVPLSPQAARPRNRVQIAPVRHRVCIAILTILPPERNLPGLGRAVNAGAKPVLCSRPIGVWGVGMGRALGQIFLFLLFVALGFGVYFRLVY